MLVELAKTEADPDSPDLTEAEKAASARAVVNLLARWEVSDDQACRLLGGLSPRTWARWKKGEPGRIDRDLATRLSLLLGIHKALRIVFGADRARAYAWIKAPNDAFGGESALGVMLRGPLMSLHRIRAYLDAERGGW